MDWNEVPTITLPSLFRFLFYVQESIPNYERKQTSINTPIRIDHFCFDFGTMTFCVENAKVELSKTEQKLLCLLVENRGRVMNRSNLVDRIWTDGAEYVDENALSVTVKRLRDKLGAQEYIKTVYGVGYSWVNKDE